jgi:outer membrane protein assembly factor BamB
MLGTGQNWAPIALVDGKLLIRDQQRMLCVRVAEE